MSEHKDDDAPRVTALSFQFIQDEDCAGRNGQDFQELRIETACSTDLADNGYLVISTERWAVSGPEDLAALLAKVAQVAGIKWEDGR